MSFESKNRARVIRAGLLTSISLFAGIGSATAQTATSAASESSAQMETIVVTGSRIARTGLDAPTPTVSLGAQDIEAGGITNTVDLLNELPQISTGLSNANTS